jgi:4,5-DOPA dioxygenase extradiol
MDRQPALFVSHGAPTLLIEDSPARSFLGDLARTLPKPRAILAASAHWLTAAPEVSGTAAPETIHDFGGFPAALYRCRYPAPGAPELAATVKARLDTAGLGARIDERRGLDHGAWVPLTLMYPDAGIPVAQLAIQPRLGPAHHLALGAALADLRDQGVLVLASGSIGHNLGEVRWSAPAGEADASPSWVTGFADWIAEAATQGRVEELLAYRSRAPFAERNHPTDEHLLPLFVTLGMAGAGETLRRIHASATYGVIAMDAYRVG